MDHVSNMHHHQYPFSNPYYTNMPHMYGYSSMSNEGNYTQAFERYPPNQSYGARLNDHGKQPFTVNINQATKQNDTFRTAIWTGDHLQVTLMSIHVGDDIGLEVHPDTDQFLRIEQGQGLVHMGKDKNNLTFVRRVGADSAIMVPAGTWHNLTNTGNIPLKLYTIYAPPEHQFGTVHRTKAEAIAAEGSHPHTSHRNGNQYS